MFGSDADEDCPYKENELFDHEQRFKTYRRIRIVIMIFRYILRSEYILNLDRVCMFFLSRVSFAGLCDS